MTNSQTTQPTGGAKQPDMVQVERALLAKLSGAYDSFIDLLRAADKLNRASQVGVSMVSDLDRYIRLSQTALMLNDDEGYTERADEVARVLPNIEQLTLFWDGTLEHCIANYVP
ncbi:MAG: hypothetical protein EBX41_00895 [Chitinophagia bacterium]|nr:hypothetical protein [Chitinophagia bacterium]